jgi:hypothetical protein
MSRQAEWQKKQKAAGCCVSCGDEAVAGSSFCHEHLVARRIKSREKLGFKAWVPGGKGRPPKGALIEEL